MGELFGAERKWNREWLATSLDVSPIDGWDPRGGTTPDIHWAMFEWRPTRLDNWGLDERGIIPAEVNDDGR